MTEESRLVQRGAEFNLCSSSCCSVSLSLFLSAVVVQFSLATDRISRGQLDSSLSLSLSLRRRVSSAREGRIGERETGLESLESTDGAWTSSRSRRMDSPRIRNSLSKEGRDDVVCLLTILSVRPTLRDLSRETKEESRRETDRHREMSCSSLFSSLLSFCSWLSMHFKDDKRRNQSEKRREERATDARRTFFDRRGRGGESGRDRGRG